MILHKTHVLFAALPLMLLSCSGGKSSNTEPAPRTTERGIENPVGPDASASGSCSEAEEAAVKSALRDVQSVDEVRRAAQKKPSSENIRDWLRVAQQSALSLEDTLKKRPLNCQSSQLPSTSASLSAGDSLRGSLKKLNDDITYLKESYRGQL